MAASFHWGHYLCHGQTGLLIVCFSLVHCPWRRRWHPTPVLLPGKSRGQRSLVGCSPWGRWESDTTERLHFHFSLSCIGGGNGNPLQCSCLENPRDGGAWWAAVYGVAQSRTWLKQFCFSQWKLPISSLIRHHCNPKFCGFSNRIMFMNVWCSLAVDTSNIISVVGGGEGVGENQRLYSFQSLSQGVLASFFKMWIFRACEISSMTPSGLRWGFYRVLLLLLLLSRFSRVRLCATP